MSHVREMTEAGGDMGQLARMTRMLNAAALRIQQLQSEKQDLQQKLASLEPMNRILQSRADAAQEASVQAEARAVQAEFRIKQLEVRVKHLEDMQSWIQALDAEVARADLPGLTIKHSLVDISTA
jgi:chromosome segregation ATPase